MSIEYNEKQYGEFGIEKNTPLSNIYFNSKFIGTHDQKNLFIYFVLPQHQSFINGEEFIDRFKNDPNIVQVIESQKDHNIKFMTLKTEKELEELNNKDVLGNILAGIVFNEDFTNYTIRIKGNDIVDSNEKAIMNYGESRKLEYIEKERVITKFNGQEFYTTVQRNEIDHDNYKMFGHNKLYYKGYTKADTYKDTFIPIQIAIDNIIIQSISNGSIRGYTANVGKLSKPEIVYRLDDQQNQKISLNGQPMAMYFIFVGPMIHLIFNIMDEKRNGIKDGLISVGVNKIIIWISWVILYLPFIIITILVVLLVDSMDIFKTINFILSFTILFFYGVSVMEITVIFCLMSKNSKLVIIILTIFYFSINMLTVLLYELKMKDFQILEKIISFLYSPFSINMAFYILTFERNRNGYIGFADLFKSEFGIYFWFIVIDIIIYFFIAVFIDYYFYDWNSKIFGVKSSQKVNDYESHALDIQEDPNGQDCYVQVRNIYKYFKYKRKYMKKSNSSDGKIGNTFIANKNISFNAYKDEIFGILGHNGAGKTTLIKIMIGLLKPESGDVFYSGLPLSKNKNIIQYLTGICLEKNVLIKGFTVAEHYKLYSRIKEIYNDLDTWLKDIDLYEKKDCQIQLLSVGQQRKLCIGLAFIGDPKYVFLDEPTTGLDPLSRQKIWRLLMKKKRDRVIFITTHDMDEADIIADRKLILKKGSIRCLGSSVYLKKHFQMRYSLEIETNKPHEVEGIIKHYIPEAEYYHDKTKVEENELLPSNSISNHTWKLAIDSSPLFSYLIKHLEEEKRKGDILSNFLVSAPRLEELFIQLNCENVPFHEDELSSQNRIFETTDNLLDKNIKWNKSMNSKDDAIELPGHDLIKKPSNLMLALRMVNYRFKMNYRNLLFIGVTIVLSFYFEIFTAIKIVSFYKYIKSNTYIKHEISAKMYSNQKWNYDISHSTSILDSLNQEILHQGPFGLDTIEIQNSDVLNAEISNKNSSDLFAHEPYYVASFSGNLNNNLYHFNIYYNDSMPHSLPSLLNSLSNAIITSNTPTANITIQVNSHPLSHLELNEYVIYQNNLTLYNSCYIISFIIFFCGSNVVKERMNKLLKLFQLNNISNFSYWLSLFINDYLWYIISCLLFILSIILFNFIPLNHLNLLILLGIHFSLSGISCILLQYILSFLFNNVDYAMISLFFVNLLPNLALVYFKESSFENNFSLKFFFISIFAHIVFPCVGFVNVIKDCVSVGTKYEIFKDESITWKHLLFKLPNKNIPHFIGSLISILLYTVILIVVIKKHYTPNKKDIYDLSKEMKDNFEKDMKDQDEDIYYEYQRIKADSVTNEIPIKMINLIKEYDDFKYRSKNEYKEVIERTQAKYGEYHVSMVGHKENQQRIVTTAFENINLGINKYECFGLLGPNGSGKTSLLNTLSLTFNQTAGDIIYEGKNILDRQSNEIIIGYCPQEDTLWEELTLSEHIEMFLFICRYSRKEAKCLAKKFIKYCDLMPHRNKYPSEMSGGTRRKLNILMALCCDSKRILLDEPSTGMDPISRHYIWKVIKATVQQNQSSLIMTTHSMEEAERLCNRIGIIVNGKLQCIGTPEHLRMKYGHTYILDVHTENIERFHKEVVVAFNLFGNDHSYKRNVISEHRVKYEIQHTITSDISRVFEVLEACRDIYVNDQYLYIDYSYSQTSLEEIFINFARLKENINDTDDIIDDTIIL